MKKMVPICGHEHHNEGHHHHHHHHHGGGDLCRKLVVIIVSALLLCLAIFVEKRFSLSVWQALIVFLVPYLLIGFDTLKEAARGLLRGNAFNEHLLMSVATIGALAIGFFPGAESEFPEAVFVMLFYRVGELFEIYAEGKSRKSIAHLMDIRPDSATVERCGEVLTVNPEEVAVGETLIVRPGEKIPLDGVVIEGGSSLSTSALTGENTPRQVSENDEVLSGCINLSGVLKMRSTRSYKEGTVARIINMVEKAANRKARSESFISRFAKVYTPIVVFAALSIAFIPPLFSGSFSAVFATWLYRALIFLVVSCPCALVISVPLTFFGGIGGASRRGVLIKGSNFIDSLSKVDTVLFDKTGTLTQGKFTVEAVHPQTCSEEQLLHLAAHVEHYSTHPIGAALRDAFPEEAYDGCFITDMEEIAGQGAKARIGDDIVYVGNSKMMDSIGVSWHQCQLNGTIVHVAINGEYAGHIVINDSLKQDSATAIEQLRKMGISQIAMLTGDRNEVAAAVAESLGISEFKAQLLPDEKVEYIEQMLESKRKGSCLAFVGDGINDAPVLARADIGIAMGALGSDAAIEAADVVLMDDKPAKIATAIAIARNTVKIARQNILFAIGIKLIVLVLAAVGISTMWMAVFADVGVTVLAVLNAMRARIGYKIKNKV